MTADTHCALLLACFLSLSPALTLQQEDVWSQGWLSDIPVVDLSGSWRFDPGSSDAMVAEWAGREIHYQIQQNPTHIVLDFEVEGGYSSQQRYRWDGTVRRSTRDSTVIEEIARWTEAGRALEVAGRWWLQDTPDEITTYRLRYEMRFDRLTFVQTNATGTTVWRFVRER